MNLKSILLFLSIFSYCLLAVAQDFSDEAGFDVTDPNEIYILDFKIEPYDRGRGNIYIYYETHVEVHSRAFFSYVGSMLYTQKDSRETGWRYPEIRTSDSLFFLPTKKGLSVYAMNPFLHGPTKAKLRRNFPLQDVGKIIRKDDQTLIMSVLDKAKKRVAIVEVYTDGTEWEVKDTLFSEAPFKGIYPYSVMTIQDGFLIFKHNSTNMGRVMDLESREIVYEWEDYYENVWPISSSVILSVVSKPKGEEERNVFLNSLRKIKLPKGKELKRTDFETTSGEVIIYGNVTRDGKEYLLAYTKPEYFRGSLIDGEDNFWDENEMWLMDASDLTITQKFKFNSKVYSDQPIGDCRYEPETGNVYVQNDLYIYEIQNIFTKDQKERKITKVNKCR